MKKSPVVHFEMPYKDGKRASEFYSKVFGWDMQQLGSEMNNYILAETTETENMQSTQAGEINGGLFPAEEGGKHTLVTIAVEDINQAIEEVKSNGGQVVHEVQEIPNVGLYVTIIDTENNRVSLLQPKM